MAGSTPRKSSRKPKTTDFPRLLGEADILLKEGMKRIASAQADIPGAQTPLEEALQMTEDQALQTIAAVEKSQEIIKDIRSADGIFIDKHLDELDSHLHTIIAGQQVQDLAGQRLKKAINLLRAVESRIAQALQEMGVDGTAEEKEAVSAPINQNDVDALLAELGI